MASAVELRGWKEAKSSSSQKLLLVVLALVLAALLLSQPVAPVATVEPAKALAPVEEVVVDEALRLLSLSQRFEPLDLEAAVNNAALAEEASEPAAAADAEEDTSAPEIPVAISSWYGNQSPYAGKPLVISGGSAGTHFWK
jgi:hypothetical protein